MVSFTFQGLFLTTYKGIPDTSNLPPSTTMSRSYYLYSLLTQATILLFFVLYFILSVYRVIKKIKNKNFREVPEQQKKEENEAAKNESEMKNQQQVQDGNKQKEKQQNLIYRFDEQDDQEQQQKKQEQNNEEEAKQKDGDNLKKEDEEKENKEQNAEQQFNNYHDANQQPFINLDQKLLFLQPFLIGFIVANNLFQADVLVLSSLILMFTSYFFINIKGFFSHLRLAPLMFMIFALVPYISLLKGDHNVST